MYRNSRRPTRKCGKCKLNFKTHCGLFDNPHDAWNQHRKCPGYLSETHYQQYLELEEKTSRELESKSSAFARRHDAKLRKTEPHYDGKHLNKPKAPR